MKSVRQSAEYFRAKGRTGRRRLLTRGWQLLDDWFRAVGRPLPRGLQNVARANYVAWKKYTAQPLDGRLTIFRATDGIFAVPRDPHLGWGDLVLGGVEIIDVPGDHVTLVEEPHVKELAVRLQECIDRAVAVGAAGKSAR